MNLSCQDALSGLKDKIHSEEGDPEEDENADGTNVPILTKV